MSLLPENPTPIPRENPFRAMARLLKSSLGNLPAHLVIIFVGSLAITALLGILMQISESLAVRNSVYLAERLSPQKEAPAIAPDQLTGTWVTAQDDYLTTLRIKNGLFELIARSKNASISRYYIRGGYKIDGNVLIMQQREDLGAPIDPDHFEYKFYPMPLQNINLYASIDGNRMIWETPSAELSRQGNPEPAVALVFGERTEWVKASSTP